MMNVSSSSPSRVRGNVLRRHAWFYDIVVGLMSLTYGRRYVRQLVELCPLRDGESVLDLGCGTGSLALESARRVGPGASVHGVDASEEMVARARRKANLSASNAQFDVGTVEALPFAPGSFDVAFSTLMLHHLPRPARVVCAREGLRVLKPGGRFMVADFETPARQRRGFLAHLHRHGGVPMGEVRKLLLATGFQLVRSGHLGVQDLHYTLAVKR
jgi:demethylmenaquinone methyltransferase/2-methoxy-6-polyprenyl-1,4-benzoquinol methylase/phosphoethanolamine N-methyltransferase